MATQLICCECGTVGKPKTAMKGSIGTELVLWIFFIFPGLLYSIWRLTTKHKVCRACGSASIIGTDTPRGQILARQFAVR